MKSFLAIFNLLWQEILSQKFSEYFWKNIGAVAMFWSFLELYLTEPNEKIDNQIKFLQGIFL